MKKLIIVSLLVISISFAFGQKKKHLFNGKNLKNWNVVVKDSAAAPDDVFWVVDGVMNAKGEPFAYIHTKKRYSNYKLHVEWRWVTKPTNSGVLLHAEGDEFWPNCVEAQLQAGNAGDFVIMGIGTAMTVEGIVYTNEDSRYTVIPKQHESNEKSAGEWNEYDIVCDGAAISITVNGVLQNKGVDGTRMKGHIALQSEGSHVQFRNVYIEKITK